MIRTGDLERAIQRGIEFLAKNQLSSGEFKTLASSDEDLCRSPQHDPSPFATMHITDSVLRIRNEIAEEIVRRSAGFLVDQMLAGGLWKFWNRGSGGFSFIPPDADDTSCIAALLRKIGPGGICPAGVLLGNRNSQGLFYTWILPRWRHALYPSAWLPLCKARQITARQRDFFSAGEDPPDREGIDAVVNANVILYLGECRQTEPARAWLAQVVKSDRETSSDRSYQSSYALYYALLRCEENGLSFARPLLKQAALKLEKLLCSSVLGTIDPLEAGLSACVLSSHAAHSECYRALILKLLGAQRDDGGWPAKAFYFGGYKRVRAWGSAELVTGFCVEALGRYLRVAS